MLGTAWNLVKLSASGCMEDGALNRGAAIAFHAIASIGLLLWIYCSAQLFLSGAEFIRAHATTQGSLRDGGARDGMVARIGDG